MRRERELERRLGELPVPGDAEGEERSWDVVRAAYGERAPAPPLARGRRVAVALAVAGLALAVGLSPAGAKVGELVEDVIGFGAGDARPALRSLPTAGELLVESEQGVWVVQEDGSKRLLGDYGEASWSPRGLFVAAADGRQLVAVDPSGEVRWTLSAPAPVADPRWSPSGFRIAYRSGEDLWVVAGDGTGERVVARDVAPVAPAWRPLGEGKLTPDGSGSHVLSYVEAAKDVRTVDADTGARLATRTEDMDLLSTPATGARAGATSPDAGSLARIVYRRGGEELVLLREGSARQRVLLSGLGRLTGPSFSPDGRWLLVGLPQADQWLFIPTERPGRLVAFDRISEQFDPGGSGAGRFPRVAGWILPQR